MVVIDIRGIKDNLLIIEKEYDIAMSSLDVKKGSVVAALCSKLAIIELGGWIEQTIDRILKNFLRATLPNTTLRESVEKEVIDKVYGFRYGDDVRPLFEKILGAGRFSKIIRNLKRRHLDQMFHSLLSDVSRMRNSAAHTYWQDGITPRFESPSVVRQKFAQLLPILNAINCYVKYSSRK